MKSSRPLSPSRFTKRVDLTSLPTTQMDTGSKGAGVFMIVFALLWGGVPTALLVSTLAAGKFTPGLLFLLLFTVVGLGLLAGGIHLLFSSVTTTLDRRQVTVTRKRLFGVQHWTEPLSAYQGVQSRSEYHSGGKNSPSYTLYIVELRHAEATKTVRLYESRSDQDLRTTWEDCCRTLGMPALAMDGNRLVQRDVADLDKSFRELVKEGKVKVDFDPSKPPPPALALRLDGDVLEFTVVKKQSSGAGMVVALLVPAVFMYVGFFVKSGPVVFGILGIGIFVLLLAGLVWWHIAKEQIRIGRDEIRTRQVTPWGVIEGQLVDPKAVETVRIGKQAGQGQNAVLLETDGGTVGIGAGLAPDSLEWLRNCVMRMLSTGPNS